MSSETKRFIVVGAGGVGNALLRGLGMMINTAFPHSVLIIVDGDTFEEKNRERQMFSVTGSKAEVLAADIQPSLMETYLIPDNRWVIADESKNKNEETTVLAKELLDEGDVVYAVVDNHAARKAIFDAAKEFNNIDVFTGGNDDKLFGSTYHYRRRNGKELIDHPSFWHDELKNPPDRNPGELSCQERSAIEGGTQVVAANMTVASILLAQTQNTIIENNEVEISEIMFDMATGSSLGYDRRVEEDETNTKSESLEEITN